MSMGSWDGDDWAVEVRSLVKRYGGRPVLNHLDLRVPRGGVHGLLGPNGSGKTTTIRILLGLARAHGGSVQVLGYEVPKQLPEAIERVGAVVESPKFAPRITGRNNLLILAESIGSTRRRVTEVLLEVGLAEAADRYFGVYSLGMKQRLAIAATLLKRPELLIFDEPTNGLDPEGIRDMRDTLRSLAEAGRTVLISSHLLSEIEQVADSVSIIARGQLVAEGAMADLLATGGRAVRVGIVRAAEAAEVLNRAGWRVHVDDQMLLVAGAEAAEVAETLGGAGLWPHELTTQASNLESVFLQLTKEGV